MAGRSQDRFSRAQYSPALFDLAPDFPGGLPLHLVARWLDSEQTAEDALRLLKEHEVRGYAVVSDCAGLTRLTGQRGLLEILALINRPKEIVHGYGAAVGGRGVGIWAADNTEMLYPAATSAETLLATLLTVQDEVDRSARIRIGLGAHFGAFYQLSGGLYGAAAEAVEALAENDTEGGEIAVTQAVVDRLVEEHPFVLAPKEAADGELGAVYRVLDGPRLAAVPPVADWYPIPYSDAFYTDLLAYEAHLDDAGLAARMAGEHLRERTVVLVEREAPHEGSHEPDLLDALALSAVMKDGGLRCLPAEAAMEVKVAGPLGIYLFEHPDAAVGFARELRGHLAERGIRCRIGVDVGPVLLSALSGGGTDIAGMPVNIASKMAQDVGAPGRLYLSEAMREHVDVSGFTPIRYTVSGIHMTAYEC